MVMLGVVPLVPYRFGASFLCFCLCRRVFVLGVCVPSSILCRVDPLYGRL